MALTRPVVPPVGSFLFGHGFDCSADMRSGSCSSARHARTLLDQECCQKPAVTRFPATRVAGKYHLLDNGQVFHRISLSRLIRFVASRVRFPLTGFLMTDRTDVARGRDIVARWCGLAEQRLDYLTELFETGRWRRYHSEIAFLENIREAKGAVETWRGLLTAEATPNNLPVDLSWIGRRSSVPPAKWVLPAEPTPEIAPQLAELPVAPAVSVVPAMAEAEPAPGP